MERRYTFIIFVGGHEYAAVCDQYIKTDEEVQAMKFGIWAAASKFKTTASVYVYKYLKETNGFWELCDSMNGKITDDVSNYLSEDFVKLLASSKHGKVKLYE